MPPTRLEYRLTNWKRQLIDLSRRNRLLNYRATSASTVEIVDEVPQQIFRQLVGGEVFEFDPAPDDDDDSTAGPRRRVELTHRSEDELPEHHRDNRLQTRLASDRLSKNLLNIYRRAEESMEEQGVNTLYLALGMLDWADPAESRTRSLAPVLMVPVSLRRDTALSPFTLRCGDDDPLLNLALIEKLRVDFSIDLPTMGDVTEELDIEEVFAGVRAAISEFTDWRLTNDVALGLFSFQKFIMYRDIELNEASIGAHPVIKAMCGEAEQPGITGLPTDIADADLDREMSPWDTVQVLDADSSQQRAMLAVRKGHNLVIEGPPGTGKSQTIANIIADSLYMGRSVLFVSEKMAALEVVRDRLAHQADLGSHILELHSNKASKREFVEEISRSLDAWTDANGGEESDLADLQRVTGELKDYVVELHRPDEILRRSPFEAFGRLAELDGVRRVVAPLRDIADATPTDLASALELIAEAGTALARVGDPRTHPLRGLGRTYRGRSDHDAVQSAVDDATDSLASLVDSLHDLAELLGLRLPRTFTEATTLVSAGEVLARAPGAEMTVLESPRWNDLSADIEALIEHGHRFAAAKDATRGRLDLAILDVDVEPVLRDYEGYRSKGFVRFFQPGFWSGRARLRGFLTAGFSPSAEELIKTVREAVAAREARANIRELETLGAEAFGARWKGPDSDWADLDRFAQWVVDFRQYVLRDVIQERGIRLAGEGGLDGMEVRDALDAATRAMTLTRTALQNLVDAGDFDASAGLDPDAEGSIEAIGRRVAEIGANVDGLRDFAGWVSAHRACEANDLTAGFLDHALATEVDPSDLQNSFERRFLELWAEGIVSDRPVLARFRGSEQEERIRRFRTRDQQSKEVARGRVNGRLSARRQELATAKFSEQLQTLQREAKKRRRILPIRKLVRRAPDALQRVKPCFMMSPLSVAQFLDAEAIEFDVLVFDEASQITPADAIGSIVRGRQVVVVGDSKQLPPTNFFGVHLDDADMTEEEELEALDDLESILDEIAVSGTPSLRLKWHYRSQHQSLIRFSNEEFYADDPLYVFPTASREQDGLGLHFVHVVDGRYEGRGRNPVEARRVAQAVMHHIESTPGLSLGVGTFGIAQQGVILDELDRLRREDPSVEWFFQQEGEEKFFVKNLENIQGDDRDVIFLSVTYGPDANGVVRRNFGPVNQQGGWRRLNVLTTRAKRCMKIFSSMCGDQIDVEGIAEGAALLRKYLSYAETGEYPASKIGLGPPDSPFEQSVIRALQAKGYRVIPQVGDSGYRIDIGVLDPDRAGRFVCGIECDGASYHSAATVRDRDRLRQQVLEDRGWDIHRVWSTDWFHSPGAETERLVELVETSRSAGPRATRQREDVPEASPPAPAKESSADLEPTDDAENSAGADRTPPEDLEAEDYVFFRPTSIRDPETFYTTPLHSLGEVIVQIVGVEGPIHHHEIARRVAEAWGMQQAGRRIRARVEQACQKLVGRPDTSVVESEGFYRLRGLEVVPVRSRAVEGAPTDPAMIALDEFVECMRRALRERAPLLPDELVTTAVRVLGFKRTGSRLRTRLEEARELLVARREVQVGGKGLSLVERETPGAD